MSVKMQIKKWVENDSWVTRGILALLNYAPFNNHFSLKGNKLHCSNALLRKSNISVYGKNNNITISKGCRLYKLKISVTGDGNSIVLGKNVVGNQLEIWVEDNNNTVTIGDDTKLAGKVHLACTESTQLSIGLRCLFSSEIVIRTGDSHLIMGEDGERLNAAKPVLIGNHVWIGHRVLITKGVKIMDESVVGTGSIVTKEFNESNVIIAGVPAQVIKRKVKWDISRG